MMRHLLAAVFAATLLFTTLAFADGAPPILPDPVLTPGAVASTDAAEVCDRTGGSYSRRHRQTTTAEKRADFERYHVPWADHRRYEDDHRGPICAGFADAPENRWPQPGWGEWNFHQKDLLEALACREVCAGRRSLAEVQSWFLAPDWRDAYCREFDDAACDGLATPAAHR